MSRTEAGPHTFERRASLRTWLLAPLAVIGGVLVLLVTIAATLAVQAQTEQDVGAQAAQSARVAVALLTHTDERLVGSSRQLATTRSLRDAVESGSKGALTADLVAMQVSQQLGLATVIDAGGRILAGSSPQAEHVARLGMPADTIVRLETTQFAWLDDELWLLSGAAQRTPGRASVAAIVGVPLDGPALAELSALSSSEISILQGGRSSGATLPDSRVGEATFRSLHGATVTVRAAVAFAPYRSTLNFTVLLIGIAGLTTLLLFVLLGAWIVQRIVRPLSRLASAAAALASGDFAGHAATDGPREVAVTSHAFNRMATAVREREAALRESTATATQAALDLQHRTLHDTLTGLPNRVLLRDRVEQAIATAERANETIAVLVMDLDGFKDVNDTLGHSAGDAFLRRVAERLRACLRRSDTVARIGGDEFACVLPGVTGEGALRAAEKIAVALREPFQVEGTSNTAEASIGVALYPRDGKDADTLLRRADTAMYNAKRTRAGASLFEESHELAVRQRLEITSELRLAIDRGQLELWYQPLVRAATGTVASLEALVRWRHPDRGLIPPLDFIPIAEQSGLIGALTECVLELALADTVRWHGAGWDLPVAVNLSARNLADDLLPQMVAEAIRRHGARPSWLTLEITETAVMADVDRSRVALARLHDMGVALAIDDFGTGHSSLAYLQRFPVAEIKLDRSFISGLFDVHSSAPIIRVAIQLCRELGITSVAEGVEDRRTWDELTRLGCDLIQGYVVSKPLPIAALGPWLDQHAKHAPAALHAA